MGKRAVGTTRHHDRLVKAQLVGKAWYLLSGIAGVCVYPYIGNFLSARGLSSSEIGLVSALRPWITAPLGLASTALADRWAVHTPLLVASLAVSTTLRAAMPLARSTRVLLALLLGAEVAGAPTQVISDALVIRACRRPGEYGEQRLWYSLGWGGCSLLVGMLMTRYSLEAGFLAYGLLSLPLLWVAACMRYDVPEAVVDAGRAWAKVGVEVHADGQAPRAAPAAPKGALGTGAAAEAQRAGGPTGQERISSVLTAEVLLFLLKAALLGFALSVVQTYQFLFLQQYGAPETLMAAALLVNCCTEVPCFQAQSWLQKRASTRTVFTWVLLLCALRLWCYSLVPALPSPWAILPVELLHGVTFSFGWGAATSYAASVGPPHLGATMMGLLQAAYLGVGVGLGGLLGGQLLQRYGGIVLFRTSAAIVVAAWALTCLADRAVQGVQQQMPRPRAKAKAA